MPTRLVIHGRTVVASPSYRPRVATFYKPKDAEVLADPRVEPHEQPFREGVPYFDPEDGIEYRSVGAHVLDPRGGWRTADFWLARWSIDWPTLRRFKDLGFVDAAIETGGMAKRFRCRDERKVLAWIEEQKRTRTQAAVERVAASAPKRSGASSSAARRVVKR